MVDPAREATEEVDTLFGKMTNNLLDHLDNFIRTGTFDLRAFMADMVDILTNQMFGGGQGGLGVPNYGGGQSGGQSGSGFGGFLGNIGSAILGSLGVPTGAFGTPGINPSAPSPYGKSAVNISFNLAPGTDASRFMESEAQISAMVSRAVARGNRSL